ncbi:MAG: hypothetical protein UX20_C0036G0004 [Candidatus Magasanikbacteria bacterium GW2011_GWC2_45_8]|uniref:Uncharacterized protein n=1 Tax=Candidatus Magasanikbacteria bacterium GW2011_GWC2_45_8 TaxID=1619050 RepID=A0A0G1MX83_9BACT|nr:MAG: hypothetical protein UX20_C0036G0004 [Candidatus Magasanikbacteria bacterium GW2011_GWC2_45_8]
MQRYPLKLFFKDYYAAGGIIAAILADVFLWLYIPLRARTFGDLAFLHYTIHFGVDFIGAWTRLLLLPALGLLIIVVHTGLGYWLYGQFKELARLVLVSQVVLCGFLIVSAVALFIIN